FTLLSGRDVLNLSGRGLYQVTVGPEGVSRELTAEVGPSALAQGWWLSWEAIDTVAYVEDPLGGPPALEVHTHQGAVERVLVAETVTAQQLADLTAAYDKPLQVR